MQRFVYKQFINIRIKHMIDGLKTFAVGLLVLIVASIIVVQPKLIGYGCDGSSLPKFAQYESDFPHCTSIEPLF
jgi:hypothetical protein